MGTTNSIGLILVHGIGNQQPGCLCEEFSTDLASTAAEAPERRSDSPSGDEGTARREPGTGELPMRQLCVGGITVHVCEAHWADRSSPDNPPVLRPATYLVRDVLRTVASAWDSAPLGRSLRRSWLGRRLDFSMEAWGVVGILATTLMLVLPALLVFVRGGAEPPAAGRTLDLAAVIVSVVLFWAVVVLTLGRRMRLEWLRLRRARRAGAVLTRIARILLLFLLAPLVAMYRPTLAIVSAEILLLPFVVAAVAVVFTHLARKALVLPRALGGLAMRARLGWLCRWGRRLGWTMIVLPVHSALQVAKSIANLMSIALSERGTGIRMLALAGIPVTIVLCLALVLLCELLILPAVIPFFLPPSGAGVAVVFGVVWTLLYLGCLKLVLPGLDVVLDIGNYHLADERERETYFEPLDRAARQLEACGCSEIHVLAHSLGTVITYDWLRSPGRGNRRISVLHTIGSPLEKFWFLDHSRDRRLADSVGLSRHIAKRWINYWAHSDPISGPLHRYDQADLRVLNRRLPRLEWKPLVSHGLAWKDAEVLTEVRRQIVACAAP